MKNKKTLRKRILSLIFLTLLLQMIINLVLSVTQTSAMKAKLSESIRPITSQQAANLARGTWLMCNLDYKRIKNTLRTAEKSAGLYIREFGEITLKENKEYQVKKAGTNNTKNVSLPAIFVGDKEIRLNYDAKSPSPFCDTLGAHSGFDVTFWQRMNKEGDMLRLAASWTTADGKRAVGTWQNRNDSGWTHIIDSVIRGETAYGNILAVDKYFCALFLPIWKDQDVKKEVIGMIGIGYDMSALVGEIVDAVSSLKVGEKGYIAIIRGGGRGASAQQYDKEAGRVVLEQNNILPNDNILDHEVNGTYPVREGIKLAKQTHDGSTQKLELLWRDTPNSHPIKKTAQVTYFEPFDWAIFALSYNSEVTAVADQVDHNFNIMMITSAAGSILIIIIASAFAGMLLKRVVFPLKRFMEAAESIADGNLSSAREMIELKTIEGFDNNNLQVYEIDKLWVTVRKMTQNLTSLVSQVQKSGVQLVSSANQIRATSRTQESTMSEFEGHVSQMAAAIREISATSQELARTMTSLQDTAAQTAEIADTGRQGLSGMEEMLKRLWDETSKISMKLAMINEKTNNINAVVTTINKVAEQTNLLSLNAAIEAEKAGEYGLGFSVVAREIRRLADQTAVATLDIEKMVQEMQSAVSVGVMEMDRFTEDVKHSVDTGGKISGQLSEVITRVEELRPQFGKVSDGMQMQSRGAGQINNSMIQLKEITHNLADSFRNFNEAADNLRHSADALKDEISRFKAE